MFFYISIKQLLCLQTHTKISKKDHPNRLATTTPEETILSVIDPIPYGTSHAVCIIAWVVYIVLYVVHLIVQVLCHENSRILQF